MGRWLLFGLASTCLTAAERTADEAARVIVVANAADQESKSLALFYASQRRIPDANIVELPLPREEEITWDVYVRELYEPLQQWLLGRGWIDGTIGELRDTAGRRRYAPLDHRVAYLVLCRGVPLRIAHDPARLPAETAAKLRAEFRTNGASVDTELALLAAPPDLREINGPTPNPLFGQVLPSMLQQSAVLRVARLDGPGMDACERMVLSAIAAEERGLAGRAYIDFDEWNPDGNVWLRSAAARLRELDFDVQEDTGDDVFAVTDRFDAAAVYFGWYAGDVAGPFRLPGFRLPTGAIALHIHSYSGVTLRSATSGWSGPLVALGAAATFGNVAEPYLQFTQRPDRLLERLSDGATLGDAAYFSLPVLSWQSIVLGDPLYRPFARSLDAQVEDLAQRADVDAPYVVLRQANRLARTGRAAEVEPWLSRASRETPAPAVSLRLAIEREQQNDPAGALRALALFSHLQSVRADEIAVAAEVAQMLTRLEAPSEALMVYRMLLTQIPAGDEWRKVLLPPARVVAEKAADFTQARVWAGEIKELGLEPEK